MRFNHTLTAWLLVSAVLASGCSTMSVHTNRADAEIYLDGRLIGVGHAKVKSMGLPNTAVIRAEHEGEVVSKSVNRKFTLATALMMPFSYFTSAIWGWQYPDSVFIRFDDRASRAHQWGDSEGDAWSKPIRASADVTQTNTAETQRSAVTDLWGEPPPEKNGARGKQ